MDSKIKNIKTDGISLTCAVCFSLLPDRKELLKHKCFNGKTINLTEDIVYCLSDNDIESNEETFNEFDPININILNNDDTNIEQEPYVPQLEYITAPNKSKKDVAMWTDNSTLALLTCYEARKEDLDHPVKRGKVWTLIADDLSEFGHKFSGEQVRWKFNTLTRKYKDCVDNSKRTGTGAMTFKFFDHMENILGDRRTVHNQHTISSTFARKNPKSKPSTALSPLPDKKISDSTSMAQSDTSIPSPSTSSTGSIDSTKKLMYLSKSESGSSKNKQVLEKVISSNTEITTCSTSVSNTQKSKRPQHGTGSSTAASKIELEKQWLQHLKNEIDRDKVRKEKQEAYEKRKAEEVQMKRKLIALKERQLDVKQITAKRKLEEVAEWHRDKLNIEKQKCRLLRELLETRTSSHSKRLNTDTDSSYED